MKRQRGRNRGGGGGSSGGKPQQQNANRAFDSNGPDGVKVRGNAQHVFEKYQQLARDASAAGDRVLGENYLQHAEHYFRLLRAMQPQRPASEILGRDHFSSGFDIDFEDESGMQQAVSEPENDDNDGDGQGDYRRDDRQRDDRARDDRPRDDRPRDDRQRDERPRDDRQQRDDRPRGEGQRNDGPRSDGQGQRRDRWRERDDRPQQDRAQQDRPQGQDRQQQQDRPQQERAQGQERSERREPRPPRENREAPRDPLPVIEPQATPLAAADTRPSPVLRDSDGGESHAPAFLQAPVTRPAEPTPAVGEDEAAPARRPRRRRAPRSFEGGEEQPSAPESEEA